MDDSGPDIKQEITQVLAGVNAGEQDLEALLPLVYGELKRLAASQVAREVDVITMGATGLLHETYLRLSRSDTQFQNRAHFFAAAGEAMRRILVERARALSAAKRGQRPTRITLNDAHQDLEQQTAVDVLALDSALSDLESRDPAMATVVKLRYFGGLTVEETAQALTVSARSVNRAWTAARAWLRVRLEA
ncbi:MAG: ECF-type sigma factor [Pseudomonadota bacterium]